MKFPGWRIAWALAITQTVGFGILFYAYTVFTLPMEAEFGWTRAQTSGAYSLALLLSGLAAVPVGRWVDARGARGIMTVGSAAGAVLVFLWANVQSLAGLYLIQAGIGLVMSAVLYDVAFTVIAVWFRRDRIRAMLLVTMVAGLASTIFIPLASGLEGSLGWRDALQALAVLLAVLTVPLHGLVLRDRPARLGWKPDGSARMDDSPGQAGEEEASIGTAEALRSTVFWWLSAAFTADRVITVAIAAHSVPLLLEAGYPAGLVAAVAGSIGIMQVVGRIIFAPATRHVSLVNLAAVTYAVRGASLVVLLLVPGVAGVWLFAVLFGLANGASTLAKAGLVADTFGPAHYGAINGAMATIIAVAQTAAPLATGALRDQAGTYSTALWLLVVTSVVATVAVLRARQPRSTLATPA